MDSDLPNSKQTAAINIDLADCSKNFLGVLHNSSGNPTITFSGGVSFAIRQIKIFY